MKIRTKLFDVLFVISVFTVLIAVSSFVTLEIFHKMNSEKRYLNTLSSYFTSNLKYALSVFEKSLMNAVSDVDFYSLAMDDENMSTSTRAKLEKQISSFKSYFPYAEMFQVRYVEKTIFSYGTDKVSNVDDTIFYRSKAFILLNNSLYLVRNYKPNEDVEVLSLINFSRFVRDFFTNIVSDDNRGIMFSLGNMNIFSFKKGTETTTNDSFIFSDERMLYDVKIFAVVSIDMVYKSIRPILIFGALLLAALFLIVLILSRQLSKKLSLSFEIVSREIREHSRTSFKEIKNYDKYKDELKGFITSYNEIGQEHDNYVKETDRIVEEKTAQIYEQNELLMEISTTDALTGLHNRRHFDESFPKDFNIARREGFYINFAIVDIDNFKEINDKYGHLCGDACLRALAVMIRKCFQRSSDEFERFGGEEFTIYNVSKESDDFAKHLNLFRDEVAKMKVRCEKDNSSFVDVSFTISIGAVSFVPQYTDTFEKIIDKADTNLYIAKRTGKNRVILLA
ncbi:MAG: GGDEF domain-containing protein [Fervidobacterium sp.]|uniref:Diguanylate cyclase (GGDEF) domain-containing protein n=1 Tax=Fervidobacterium gondwanense DSM 13020 TaxID=1121883 RepID=A0A1M7T9Q0_FERGO|nr:GGDEF domain-containing protein [Fervidobacterium gondwanense]SHN67465.1 diguanylate cyclase (GGDEF) domain-containing protein [Fervidobacterium gondwanense DSM 13020]